MKFYIPFYMSRCTSCWYIVHFLKYCVQTHFIVPWVNIFRYIIYIIIILTTGHIWLKIQGFSVDAKTRLMNNFHGVLFKYLQLMIRKIRIYCIFQAYKMHTIHKRPIHGFNSKQFDWHVHLYINAFDDNLLYTSVKAGNYDQFSGVKV